MRQLHVTNGRAYVRLDNAEIRLDELPRPELRPNGLNIERRYDTEAGFHIQSTGNAQSAASEGYPWSVAEQVIADAEAFVLALRGPGA